MTSTGFSSLKSYRTSRLLHFSHCWQGGCSSFDCLCVSSSSEAADVAVSCKVPLTGLVQSAADVARFSRHGSLDFQSLFSFVKMNNCYV
jgi:hypothetical protein